MKHHPAACLFPMLDEEALAALSEDVKARGLLESIVLCDGAILDGRNRHAACERAGVQPRFVTWAGQGGSPTQYVLSTNLHRRHLTSSQRAMVAQEALPLLEEEGKQRMQQGGARGGATTKGVAIVPPPCEAPRKARDDAAKAANVSPRYVQDAKKVATEAPDLAQEVREGKKSLPQAVAEVKKRLPAPERPAPRFPTPQALGPVTNSWKLAAQEVASATQKLLRARPAAEGAVNEAYEEAARRIGEFVPWLIQHVEAAAMAENATQKDGSSE
jgi:hypothetical protein